MNDKTEKNINVLMTINRIEVTEVRDARLELQLDAIACRELSTLAKTKKCGVKYDLEMGFFQINVCL